MTRVLPAVRRLRHLARAMSSPSSSLRASFDRFMQDETIDLEFVERPPSWPSSSLTGSAYRRIAVYDSSFNPPTRAHLALASASPHDHDGILILLSTLNADTKSSQSSSTFPQRLEMISRGLLPKLTDPPAAFALIRGPIFRHVGSLRLLYRRQADRCARAAQNRPSSVVIFPIIASTSSSEPIPSFAFSPQSITEA